MSTSHNPHLGHHIGKPLTNDELGLSRKPTTLKEHLVSALIALDEAEKQCTKPAMSTQIGVYIAAAHTAACRALRFLNRGEKP